MIKTIKLYSKSAQSGFTLVEIMVGMAIGMLVTLVIVQVMSVFEGQKRATSGTADSQTNGAIALYNISRELQQAGFGLIPTGKDQPNSALKCDTVIARPPGSVAVGFNVTPLTMTNGVSDSITVRYGNTYLAGMPSSIVAVSGRAITVDNNLGCSDGDFVMITKSNQCAFSQLAKVSDAPPGVEGSITLNLKADSPAETMPAIATPGNSSIICLGSSWSQINYAVNNGILQKGGVDSVAGVVNIQAQYGVSATATSNQITAWVNPTGATWGTPNLANRNRIKAVRIAVVARNPKREQAEVTQGCSSLTAAEPTGLCSWEGTSTSPAPAIDLSADADWKHYRYRVFETIVPLRNLIWNANTLN